MKLGSKVKVYIFFEKGGWGVDPLLILSVNAKDIPEKARLGEDGKSYEMFLGEWDQREQIVELLRKQGLKCETRKGGD